MKGGVRCTLTSCLHQVREISKIYRASKCVAAGSDHLVAPHSQGFGHFGLKSAKNVDAGSSDLTRDSATYVATLKDLFLKITRVNLG